MFCFQNANLSWTLVIKTTIMTFRSTPSINWMFASVASLREAAKGGST